MNEKTVQATKRCSKCGEEKPATVEFFNRHPSCSFGLNSQCRTCSKARATVYDRARGIKPAPQWPERFWANVGPKDPRGCREWIGCIQKKTGYGLVLFDNKPRLAHRMAWLLHHGTEPPNLVLHRCDNRACCAVEHLFSGTHKDNYDDMVAKGRTAIANRPRLTPDSVRTIRRELAGGASLAALGRRFGVRSPTIAGIRDGKAWRHVR